MVSIVKITKVGPNHIIDFIDKNNRACTLKFIGEDIQVFSDKLNNYIKEHYAEVYSE
jgi:hypothetical protein